MTAVEIFAITFLRLVLVATSLQLLILQLLLQCRMPLVPLAVLAVQHAQLQQTHRALHALLVTSSTVVQALALHVKPRTLPLARLVNPPLLAKLAQLNSFLILAISCAMLANKTVPLAKVQETFA